PGHPVAELPGTRPGDAREGSPLPALSQSATGVSPAQNATGNAPIPGSRCRTIAGHQAGAAAVDGRSTPCVPEPRRSAGVATPPSWQQDEAVLVVWQAPRVQAGQSP